MTISDSTLIGLLLFLVDALLNVVVFDSFDTVLRDGLACRACKGEGQLGASLPFESYSSLKNALLTVCDDVFSGTFLSAIALCLFLDLLCFFYDIGFDDIRLTLGLA